MPNRRIPEATVARLPVYLRCLLEMNDSTTITVSSERLAELAGVNAAKVRKDLSYLGSYGTRGVGYDVEYLLFQISRELGLMQDWPVAIVGIGNLGHALANYKGFPARGFRVVALVDADPAKVGEQIGDLRVRALDELPAIAAEEGIAIGIIATPAPAAQEVADRLVAAGVSSILNFAPALITVPPSVSLRKVDLSIELQILSFYQQRRSGGHKPRSVTEPASL
jgi:redox-sensing transcriptional repressor